MQPRRAVCPVACGRFMDAFGQRSAVSLLQCDVVAHPLASFLTAAVAVLHHSLNMKHPKGKL